MPIPQTHRLDELPLDRRIAGEARGLSGGANVGAIYERRELEPTASHVKRRTGTVRVTNSLPSLLGATRGSTKGAIKVDHDFTTATGSDWSIFGTLDFPVTTDTDTRYFKILSFGGIRLYARVSNVGGTFYAWFTVLDTSNSQVVSSSASAPLYGANGNTFQFFLCRDDSAGTARLNVWYLGGSVGADASASHTFTAEAALEFFGEAATTLSAFIPDIVLNNVVIYDNDDFTTGQYAAIANDTTPNTSGLLWHDTFSEGGDILVHDDSDPDIYSYLVPSQPQTYGATPTSIRFGGNGTAEIPFYLDFDEYFWTTTNAAARENWCFQLKLTLPEILQAATVFELQDLVRLEVFDDSGTWKFKASFSDDAALVTNTTALAAGTSYDVFVARDSDNVYLKVDSTEVNTTAPNPIVYAYDKTLGFVIGDKVDFENSAPFGGQLERFALHNDESRSFGTRTDAVLYYDVDSVQGDELIDRGNRALNGYLGVRSDTQSPYYKQGGFPGGAYVAASGGYLISNARPNTDYDGELRKPLTKDAVVQRRGQRAFLTSNGVSYIVDDKTESFRALGIPRPSTKVSCTPQGVGAIDGFVRYAYRYVSIDGTVGPVFELDPCDATGGVNVYLGAETFGTPSDPAFGLSYGEAEKDKLASNDEVEMFLARDIDSSDGTSQLLHKEIAQPGLTLETAIRFPNLGSGPKESVISQGVHAPNGVGRWMARNNPKTFPWIGERSRECCFQFSFRFSSANTGTGGVNQCLFSIGSDDQKYETGWLTSNTHWKLNHLVVSIQTPGPGAGNRSIVITRDDPQGDHHRDDDLKHTWFNCDLTDQHDYTIFVRRGGSLWSASPGADLVVMLYDHTDDTWENWSGVTAGTTAVTQSNFWGAAYSGSGVDNVRWGALRFQSSSITGKTRVRSGSGLASFGFDFLYAFRNDTATDNTGGQRMYHGRMWRRDFDQQLLAQKALDRYGARTGPLATDLEIDVAFCPDSSVDQINGGWDYPNDIRVKFKAPGNIDAKVAFTTVGDSSVFLAYGYDTGYSGSPTTYNTDSTDDIPLWCQYSSRDEGSLLIGTGRYPAVTIAEKKWHTASKVQTFDEFASVIDLKEWTWLTLYFNQVESLGTPGSFNVWLERVFIDGNTGDWGDLYNADTSVLKAQNTGSPTATQYGLFSCGGVLGIDNDYEVEVAETRLWDGERYTAQGGGSGSNAFGPYLSTRVPPSLYSEMHHYLRFAPLDVDDMAAQTEMDQKGAFANTDSKTQLATNNVKILQGAEVKEGGDAGGSGGAAYFIPFPTPPLSSIRGIQIFRTQIVPVQEDYPNGEPNPNAQTDAFKACRAAPLYYLSEIPDGTQAYFDTATDALLGAELNLTEGLIPGNPGGVFEWDNFLGIWVTDIPRIHFAASPDSWESFPSDMVLDLPLKEYGTIEAATELASRDARNSRVLVLGKSWGLFLDGSPMQPRTNTLGGGVGAASSRCLVVEKGIAYAYNGTLWAISGDGQVEDIGMPVLDLLPPPDSARLSVSSSLGSLYVINEDTGLTLRWHFARREWFVEDRSALSTTDIAGVDNWVHLSGYPSAGDSTVYADDVESDTATSYTVSSWDNGADTLTLSSVTGLKAGQFFTVASNEDPRIRQTLTIESVDGSTITTVEDLDLSSTSSNQLSGESQALTYSVYVGVGYWGTMLDTGQFRNTGVLHHVDMGVTNGDGWHAMSAGADFAGDPSNRGAFDAPESYPTAVSAGGAGVSSRVGLTERQRIQRVLVWTYEPEAVGLSELELTHSPND